MHPVHAALILARLGADEETIQAAILHDVVEDCPDWDLVRVRAELGEPVAAIVAELTEDKSLPWEERKGAIVAHASRLSERARLVKAADKLHNLASLVADLRAAERQEDVWRHFSRGPEQTLAMSRQLVLALAPLVEPRLGAALRATLAELEAVIAGA